MPPALKALLVENAENLVLGEIAIRETFFSELGITDEEVCDTPIAPTAEQAQMMEAFVLSSEMEYAFWEMAYRKETWLKKDW